MKPIGKTLLLSVVFLLGVGFIFGCSKKSAPPAAAPKASATKEKAAAPAPPARPPRDTRLHAAIKAGDLDKIKSILREEFGKNLLYVEDQDGNKPIIVAALAKADIEVFRLLISINPDQVRGQDKRGRSVPNIAFEQGRNMELMKLLLANLDTLGDFTSDKETGNTLLHLAAAKGNTELARFLLEKKASPRVKNRQGKTALDLAQDNGHQETINILVAHGGVPLEALIAQGDLEKFKTAIESNPENLRQTDKAGKSLFHTVIEKGKEGQMAPFLEFLLQKDAALLTKTYDIGYTPLDTAVRKRRLDVIALLLEKGVDVNSANNEGYTVLHAACYRFGGNLETVKFLLEKGANLHARTTWGGLPIHEAGGSGNPSIAQYLLEKGAELDARDKYGNTPLLKAAAVGRFYGEGSKKVAQLLLDKGADLKATNYKGQTALHLAADYFCADMVRFFLERGLDPNQADLDGNTPLHLLFTPRAGRMDKDDMDSVVNCRKALLEKGANANARNKKGETPLLPE